MITMTKAEIQAKREFIVKGMRMTMDCNEPMRFAPDRTEKSLAQIKQNLETLRRKLAAK
jgi:hypothetical protein